MVSSAAVPSWGHIFAFRLRSRYTSSNLIRQRGKRLFARFQHAVCLEGVKMKWRILSIVLLVGSLPAAIGTAQDAEAAGGGVKPAVDDAPARQTITAEFDSKAELHERLVQELKGPVGNVFKGVVVPTPPAIAAAVESWTGISDRGSRVLIRFIHNTRHSKYVTMSYGDGYSRIGGKDRFEHETHVRYEETLTACDAESFCILGLYEFEDAIAERRCTVICRLEGVKSASGNPFAPDIHATGTATWIGPIIDASGSAFREDFIVQSNSRLNVNNVKTILDNADKYTDADVVQLLGPADSISVGGDQLTGRTEMMWEEVSRIELTFRDDVLSAMSGKFSPHHRSEQINYPAFKKLQMGMTLYDVHQHCCHVAEKSRETTADGTTIRTYEIYNRLRVYLQGGKVRSAHRVSYGVDR